MPCFGKNLIHSPLIKGVLLILVLGLGSACSEKTAPETMLISATIFPLADWCRNIAPPEARVVCLIAPNVSPHTFEPGIREAKELSRSRLVVCVGKNFDGWVEPLIRGAQGKNTEILNLIEMEREEVHDLQNQNPDRSSLHPHEDDDPEGAILKISERLKQIWPEQSEIIEKRAQEYLLQLRDLHLEITKTVAEFKYKSYVGFHGSLIPFARRYGLTETASIEPWAGKEPSLDQAKRIVEILRGMEHPVIFVEPQLNKKAASVFAEEVGCPVLELDPLGDPNQPERNSYVKMMRYNLESLKKGLSDNHG